MLYGDNVDTLRPDGLQFLTFKLSFNDYYAQDISNKIKSVKFRKIEKGEFQGGIVPYGYKKDKNIKNHLVIDEYASNIVKEIFNMYVNKGMSPAKIADELNRREVLAPAVYLKIPTYMKRESSNPNGKYLWLRTQIGKILKNEVYIGNVVGRKFQKISHKIAKVRTTNPDEYIIVENMHEPIIDVNTWNKAQEKIKNKHITRTRKYSHPLKGLVFCKECGGIATLRCRTETRKTGKEWRADYFICSNSNVSKQKCKCKQIRVDYIENEVKSLLKREIEKIIYSKEELKEIYRNSQIDIKTEICKLTKQLKKYKDELKFDNDDLAEIYRDKVQRIITEYDFKMLYKKKTEERDKISIKIQELELEIKELENKLEDIDIEKIIKNSKEILNLENITKEMYEKLIEKIGFNSEKKIYIKFKFSKYI